MIWKHNLDSTSIFASPSIDEKSNILFVATLSGGLFCLNAITGEIIWNAKLGKPCFGTPCLNKKKFQLFIGTCEGLLFCYTFDRTFVRFFLLIN